MKKEILILIGLGVISGFFSIKGEINDWDTPEIDDDIIEESIPYLNVNVEDVKLFAFFSNFFNQTSPSEDLPVSINNKEEKNNKTDLVKLLADKYPEEEKDYVKEKNVEIEIIEKEEAEKIIFTEYEEVNSDNEIDKLFEDISEELEIKEEEETTDEVFMVVEEMPRFKDCLDAQCTQIEIMKYISKNTIYPKTAKENFIMGRVFVSFVVNKNGEVDRVKVLRGVDQYLDAEAVRVVQSMPKFKPGKQRGKTVNVQYNVPINFKLDEIKPVQKTEQEKEVLEVQEEELKMEEVKVKEVNEANEQKGKKGKKREKREKREKEEKRRKRRKKRMKKN